jgi:hypothetical protein
VRVGRIAGQNRRSLRDRISYWARAYLYYLALKGHLQIDYDWLLAVGDLCVHDVADDMRIDLGVITLAQEGAALGLRYANSDRAMRWTLGRLALRHGARPAERLNDEDVNELFVAVRQFGERPDLSDYWTSVERYGQVSKQWITRIGQLRLVLYHRGQAQEPPRVIKPFADMAAPQPAMGALAERWLQRRKPTWRPATLYHNALTVRRFLEHLHTIAPDVQSFSQVKHDHIVSWIDAMATEVSTKTGRPLDIRSRRGRVVRLAQFFKDAEDWAWPDVVRDLPRPPDCVPRYIPRADLERLMEAIRALPDPFQRAALLIARWSGARRNEIRRLTTDCLDSYGDGTARLRLPVGKTARERLVPLHEEAAEALRAILAIRADQVDRELPDERTGQFVRFVFV